MTNEQASELQSEFGPGLDELPATVDRAAVERIRLVAYALDESITVPGTNVRVGLDPLIGVLPVAGDVVAGGLSLYIVIEAARLGVSYGTLVKMLANVSLDVAIGSIPYVGDLFDVVWKANKRNLALVVEDLTTDDGGPSDADVEPVEIAID